MTFLQAYRNVQYVPPAITTNLCQEINNNNNISNNIISNSNNLAKSKRAVKTSLLYPHTTSNCTIIPEETQINASPGKYSSSYNCMFDWITPSTPPTINIKKYWFALRIITKSSCLFIFPQQYNLPPHPIMRYLHQRSRYLCVITHYTEWFDSVHMNQEKIKVKLVGTNCLFHGKQYSPGCGINAMGRIKW